MQLKTGSKKGENVSITCQKNNEIFKCPLTDYA